jgi:hypothetical protein
MPRELANEEVKAELETSLTESTARKKTRTKLSFLMLESRAEVSELHSRIEMLDAKGRRLDAKLYDLTGSQTPPALALDAPEVFSRRITERCTTPVEVVLRANCRCR